MFNPYRIKEVCSKDNQLKYTPERRVYLFFWNQWFPSSQKGVIKQAFTSTSKEQAEEWLEEIKIEKGK